MMPMKKSNDVTQVMALSLFMIVLAFFIVLNSISDFKEEKTIPVLASLEAAFATKIVGEEKAPSMVEDQAVRDLFSGGQINQLEIAFKNNFDILTTKINTAGTKLQVEILRTNFLNVMQKRNTPGFEEFRQKLLLFMNNSSIPYRLDVVFQEENPAKANLGDQKITPDILLQTGFSFGSFKISTRQGNPERLVLMFSPKYQPLLTRGVFE